MHIHAKQADRAVGEMEIRNRRWPARDKAIERLLCADHLLNHPHECWLPTEGGKTRVGEKAGIDSARWPTKMCQAKHEESETTQFFVEKFPLPRKRRSARRAVAVCVNPSTTNTRLKGCLEASGSVQESLVAAGFALSLVHISQRPDTVELAPRRPEQETQSLGFGNAEEAAFGRIRNAIQTCTEEALELVDGREEAFERAREIFERRSRQNAGMPIEVGTGIWTSKLTAQSEDAA